MEEQLDEVVRGSIVDLKGYLVHLTADKGWHWKSSLRRDDNGGGSCELMWVEEIKIENGE